MIVNKIGLDFKKYNNSFTEKSKDNRYNTTPQEFKGTVGQLNINYFVPFTARGNKKSNGNSKLDNILFYTDTSAKNLISTLQTEAKASKYDKITTLHVIKHGLNEINQFIEDLNSGKKDYNTDELPVMAEVLGEQTVPSMFSNLNSRKTIQPIIKEKIAKIDDILADNKPNNVNINKGVNFSEDLIDSIWGIRENQDEVIDPYIIMSGAINSQDDITEDFVTELILDIDNKLMINNKPSDEQIVFSDYEPKASNILKNLSLTSFFK